jgi:preprotein translocase subunit SecG
MLYYLLTGVYVLVCLLLLLVILLQQGRAGDIASAFGGSSSQTAFGARSGATLLTRATAVLAVMFIVGAVGLAVVYRKGPRSVVSGVKLPAAQTAPAKSSSTPAAPASSASQPAVQTAPASTPTAPAAAPPAAPAPAPAPAKAPKK